MLIEDLFVSLAEQAQKEMTDFFDELIQPEEISNEEQFYNPNLPEWREYILNDIREYTDMWVESYIQSFIDDVNSRGGIDSLVEQNQNVLSFEKAKKKRNKKRK